MMGRKYMSMALRALVTAGVALCILAASAPPSAPPSAVMATSIPATAVPATIAPTSVPPTAVPATAAPSPTTIPPTAGPTLPPRTIKIDVPVAGDTIFSPAELSGSVSVTPFEKNLVYRVYEGAGSLIGKGPVTVKGEQGLPGTFAASAVFSATTGGPGRVEVVDINQADGSTFATASVDVRILTAEQAQLPGTESVSGTVTYPAGVVLGPDAVLQVDLLEVTPSGGTPGPNNIIMQELYRKPGPSPVAFEVGYDPASIVAKNRYFVRATVVEKGKNVLSGPDYPVITLGNPTQVQIQLQPPA